MGKRESIRKEHQAIGQERRMQRLKQKNWDENRSEAFRLKDEINAIFDTEDSYEQNRKLIPERLEAFIAHLDAAGVMSGDPMFRMWAEKARAILEGWATND